MRVIGVVDLLAGRAVHARAGRRGSYEPVRALAGVSIEPGDALALAQAYVVRLGVTELYAADLEAILGRPSQDALVAAVAAIGPPVWLDAAISCTDRARHALGLGAAHVVVGLETLASYEALGKICAALGGDRVAFSLDLRAGAPVAMADGQIPRGEPAHVVASRAASMGVGTVIVLDLARVGTGAGLDLELIARVRKSAPGQRLLAGGGVRGYEDLAQLADAGCDGALVATALQSGRIGAADVASARRLSQGRPMR